MMQSQKSPDKIEVRGARAHNLKNIDVDIPLGKIVGIAGVSGSGKSSLALGVLYAEGSRRYLESLSTYTRRRMTQASRAQVDEVRYVPAALALHQRPGVPGIRSTFGTMSELLNSLRLMFSRLSSHRCPNGHYLEPSLAVAAEQELVCPVCGAHFFAPGAEELAFNSQGACKRCGGTGTVWTVDESTLVPDDSLSIDEGAVAPWGSLMWSLMKDIARDMGVRTDIPFRELSPEEKDIVYHGPAEKRHIIYKNEKTNGFAEMDFTYYSAVYSVENALAKVTDEKGMKRVEKFLRQDPCPDCGGTRLSDAARAPRLRGISLADACRMTLAELIVWVEGVPASLPEPMRPMAERICESFQDTAKRLVDLGLSYLSLDRAASTLSTGERQRVQLARSVRNRTTGVLYVLDEPSIGLHPSNLEGLTGVMDDLVADGNSVVLVDHDTQVLSHADWIIELGPDAGAGGGTVLAQGTVADIRSNPVSKIGPFLEIPGQAGDDKRAKAGEDNPAPAAPGATGLFAEGGITLRTGAIHTVQPLEVRFPKGRLSVVTGVSGSGKTTMILESLIPGLQAAMAGKPLPAHVMIAELALVFAISGAINRLSLSTATMLFVLYSVINGAVLSYIFLIYTMTSIASVFFITAGTFAVMAFIGYTTKTDLTSMGKILLMAIIGLIIASLVNVFLVKSSGFDLIISYAGVLIFVGLTAYDSQKIKQMLQMAPDAGEASQKLALVGALSLYLDFINLFIYLLRILGKRE